MIRDIIVGGACLNQTPLDWQHNLSNIQNAIELAKAQSVELLCLPELCITGYGCEDMFLSDWVPEKALDKLEKLLPFSKGITITVGLPFRHEHQTYNCIAILKDERIEGVYAKHHLANDGVHYEPRWFASWPLNTLKKVAIFGNTVPFGSFEMDLNGLKVAFEICEDAWKEDRPACYYQHQPDIILNRALAILHLVKDASERIWFRSPPNNSIVPICTPISLATKRAE